LKAVWLRVRVDIRSHWGSWALIALLIGVSGAAALTAAGGARRTDTAYARFLASSNASDVTVSPQNGTGLPSFYAALARLPGVRALGTFAGLRALPVQAFPLRLDDPAAALVVEGTVDGGLGLEIDRPRVVSGRMFGPDRREAVIDRDASRLLHLGVGSSLTLAVFPPGQDPSDLAHARLLAVRVAGIVTGRSEVVTLSRQPPRVLLGPGTLRELGPSYFLYDGAYVQLARGTSADELGRRAQALAGQYPETAQRGSGAASNASPLLVANEADEVARVERTIRPQAVTLALFALVAAVAAWLIIGQQASRQLFLASVDNPTLRALGMSGGQFMAVGLVEVGVAAVCGMVLAVLGTVAASGRMPIGPARLAEPHPGVELNAVVLVLGALVIVIPYLARAAWSTWRLTAALRGPGAGGAERGDDRSSALGVIAVRAGMPASATVGLQTALEAGRGRTAVPVRPTLVGTILSIATVSASLVFGTNLIHLVRTPGLYGQTWDLSVSSQFQNLPTAPMTSLLQGQRGVVAWSFGAYGDLAIGGQRVSAIGLGGGSGPLLFPALLEGRAPAAVDEIVLGSAVLQRNRRHVGQSVTVEINGQPTSMRIVGRAVFPAFGRAFFNATDLGEGAAVSSALLAQPDPAAPNDPYSFVLARFAQGPSRPADMARFLSRLQEAPLQCTQVIGNGNCQVSLTQPPITVLNYAPIEGTPLVLAGLLAILASVTLGQLMATSVRRRRRDLAVLKVLGFVRRQISAVVAWQASVVAVIAVLVGLPLGVAAGNWAWRLFAEGIGVAPSLHLPFLLMVVVGILTIAAANLVAFEPGWVAGRIKVSEALRSE
jgi:hypothetical protein